MNKNINIKSLKINRRQKISLFVSLILISSIFINSQTSVSLLNWTALTGKWECVKVTRLHEGRTKDVTKKYRSYFCNFFEDFRYHDELSKNSSTKIVVDGKYRIDKTKNLIGYADLIQTVKINSYTFDDQAQQIGKPRFEIIKLENSELILYYKETANEDEVGEYSFYFKKTQ